MVTAGLAGRSASAAAPPLRTGGQITCEHTRQSGFFWGLSEGRTFYLSQTKEMPCSLPRDEGRFLSLFDGGAENSPSASPRDSFAFCPSVHHLEAQSPVLMAAGGSTLTSEAPTHLKHPHLCEVAPRASGWRSQNERK